LFYYTVSLLCEEQCFSLEEPCKCKGRYEAALAPGHTASSERIHFATADVIYMWEEKEKEKEKGGKKEKKLPVEELSF